MGKKSIISKLTKDEREILEHLPLWFQKLREVHLKRYNVDLFRKLENH